MAEIWYSKFKSTGRNISKRERAVEVSLLASQKYHTITVLPNHNLHWILALTFSFPMLAYSLFNSTRVRTLFQNHSKYSSTFTLNVYLNYPFRDTYIILIYVLLFHIYILHTYHKHVTQHITHIAHIVTIRSSISNLGNNSLFETKF